MMLEVELKMAIPKNQIPFLYTHPFLGTYSQGPSAPQFLLSTYYDTEQHVLWKNGFALRVREHNQRFIQTVKTAGSVTECLHQRYEWEQVIPQASPVIDLFSKKELRRKLNKLVGDQILKPLFKTEFTRIQWDICLEDATELECVLDQGVVSSTNCTASLCELELELKRGEPSTLLTIANILRQSILFTEESQSKAERGYLLCTPLTTRDSLTSG